jgi:hypothetical protein
MNCKVICKFGLSRSLMILTVLSFLLPTALVISAENHGDDICKPELLNSPVVELGAAAIFEWACSERKSAGEGFYVVFIRPSGTYVLLKVPKGRTSFEFTPDTVGQWRWMVINTHPDRTKPDIESALGYFKVNMGDSDK